MSQLLKTDQMCIVLGRFNPRKIRKIIHISIVIFMTNDRRIEVNRGKPMSKKHNSRLYNAPRTVDDIEPLASDDYNRIDKSKEKATGTTKG